jgi:hypothetical protein
VFQVRTRVTTRYCVTRRKSHNSPVEWAAHRLPGGPHLPTPRETHLNLQPEVLRSEHRAEDRREERLEQLRVELREQGAVQRGMQVEVEVKVEVEMERKTQAPTQQTTRLKTLLEVLPDVLRGVHRGEDLVALEKHNLRVCLNMKKLE